jgi:hypothetical protein
MGDLRGYIEPIGISLGIGLLIGLEREWAHKDVGLRTFALLEAMADPDFKEEVERMGGYSTRDTGWVIGRFSGE